MSHDPDRHVMEKAYARWAPIYDALCGPVFVNGRRAAARAARDVGGCILEIGVGTGLSFDDYDAHTEITGIDISEPMIARARARAKSGRYPFVKELVVMDAHALAYADASFDCVVGQFVITLVANPERVLSECARVVRPRWPDHPRQSSLFGARPRCGPRASPGAEGAAVRPAAGISVPAPGRLGADARRCGADRAAQAQAVWRLHAGAIQARRGAMRGSLKMSARLTAPSQY